VAWGIEETLLLVINLLIVALIIWALRKKVRLKLDEVEARHQRTAEHRPPDQADDPMR
jgi:large-conductance mechanosensitive channel